MKYFQKILYITKKRGQCLLTCPLLISMVYNYWPTSYLAEEQA